MMKAFLSFFFVFACFVSHGQHKAPEVDSLLAMVELNKPYADFAQDLMSDEAYAQYTPETRQAWNELFVAIWEILKKERLSENILKVYPNPTSNQLHLNGDWQNIRQITAIDEQGKQMDLNMNQLNEGILSLEELPVGRYIVTFHFKAHTMMKRVVKQ